MARSKRNEYSSAEQIGVIYARYSSHNQKEESIEQQIAECSDFAAKNGIRIVGIYADKAVSGRSDRRPNFQRMMRDAEKRQFQIVVAYKSNRIARNMLNALQYEARLDLLGIKTLYAKEEFGNTAAGRFALRTMMNVNQFYSENMGEDIKRGMLDNAENCKVNGALPLGYVSGPDKRYAIEPKEAEIVRGIYDKVLDADVRPNNNDNWATLWNNRLEVLQQERFFKIGENRVSGTQYGTEAEAKAAAELRLKRYIAKECSSKSKTFTGEAIEIAKRVIRRKFGANRIATAYVMVFKYDNAYCVSYRDRTYRLR